MTTTFKSKCKIGWKTGWKQFRKEDGKRTLLHRISQSMVGSKANMKALIKLLNIQNSHQGLGNMSNIDISTWFIFPACKSSASGK